MSDTRGDVEQVFEQLDQAGLPDDFRSDADRDRSLPMRRDAHEELVGSDDSQPLTDEDRAWMKREDWEPDYDDEPRTDGKSALDLFHKSCEAGDRERRESNSHDRDCDEAVPNS